VSKSEDSQVLKNHEHFVLRMVRRAGMPGAIDLTKRRVWFAEDPGGEADDDQLGGGEGGDDKGQVPIASLPQAVQDYITDLRQQAAEYRTKFKDLSDQVATDTDQRLAQNQQYKELADKRGLKINELEPLAAQAKDAAEFLQALNTQTIEALPEAARSLVPDFGESYDGQKRQAAWLKANAAKLTRQPAPDFDAGAGNGSGGKREPDVKLTPEEALIVAKMGMTPEEYRKAQESLNPSQS
jgi:hypothetical protein